MLTVNLSEVWGAIPPRWLEVIRLVHRPYAMLSAGFSNVLAISPGWLEALLLRRPAAKLNVDSSDVWAAVPAEWNEPLPVLRRKWGEIPSGNDKRLSSAELLKKDDRTILEEFERALRHDEEGTGWGHRGWYHDLYRPLMPGRKLLDIGCGMGLSTIPYAQMGAHVTFTDIIAENVELVRRIASLKGIKADFFWIENFEDYDRLPGGFDIVTALGSLINAPLAITRDEIGRIVKHLRPGGRWLHFAYPKARWIRDGSLPYPEWGQLTDGAGTPWVEYHDRGKIEWLFAGSEIRILFNCEWHDSDFNWFDIEVVKP
jgi:2-polyprenyl-3-methyl-5-hydroxy-6-metoxy-1,4-benzoquinol methylase